MSKSFYTYLFLFFAATTFGQRMIQPKMIEFDWKGIVYKYEKSFEFRMHDNGWAMAFNRGTILAYDKAKYFQFEIGATKDNRERRQSTNSIVNVFNRSRAFIFGKQNAVINVRLGIGRKKYLSEKARRKGVAVGYTYEIGPSIAIMKPYYLELQETTIGENNAPITTIYSAKYSAENEDMFLNSGGNDIFGASSYFKGFDELFLRVGGQGKVAAHFAFGAYEKLVKSVEAGIMFDIYPRKLPIMIETEDYQNKNIFLRLYLSMQFGWRNNS